MGRPKSREETPKKGMQRKALHILSMLHRTKTQVDVAAVGPSSPRQAVADAGQLSNVSRITGSSVCQAVADTRQLESVSLLTG